MPYYNVHAMDESDLHALYLHIKSLGDPGEQVPDALPPGEEPKTPYVIAAPPIMPKAGGATRLEHKGPGHCPGPFLSVGPTAPTRVSRAPS